MNLHPFHIVCENGHLEVVKLLINDDRFDILKSTLYCLNVLEMTRQSREKVTKEEHKSRYSNIIILLEEEIKKRKHGMFIVSYFILFYFILFYFILFYFILIK